MRHYILEGDLHYATKTKKERATGLPLAYGMAVELQNKGATSCQHLADTTKMLRSAKFKEKHFQSSPPHKGNQAISISGLCLVG